MNKKIYGILLMLTLIILSAFASAESAKTTVEITETVQMKDTVINYVPYREIVVNDPGIVYPLSIANTGTREKTYEIIPDTEQIRNIGTYRIDPADQLTISPGEQKTAYFFLKLEKKTSSRLEIPVTIRSGLADTEIELVARQVGPLQTQNGGGSWLATAFNIVIIAIIIIIIIIALVITIHKTRSRKEEEEYQDEYEDLDEEIESYY